MWNITWVRVCDKNEYIQLYPFLWGAVVIRLCYHQNYQLEVELMLFGLVNFQLCLENREEKAEELRILREHAMIQRLIAKSDEEILNVVIRWDPDKTHKLLYMYPELKARARKLCEGITKIPAWVDREDGWKHVPSLDINSAIDASQPPAEQLKPELDRLRKELDNGGVKFP